jgi:hypothetical protein
MKYNYKIVAFIFKKHQSIEKKTLLNCLNNYKLPQKIKARCSQRAFKLWYVALILYLTCTTK